MLSLKRVMVIKDLHSNTNAINKDKEAIRNKGIKPSSNKNKSNEDEWHSRPGRENIFHPSHGNQWCQMLELP